MSSFSLKVGDIGRPLDVTLSYSDGSLISLSGVTSIQFVMARPGNSIVTGTATVLDYNASIIRYQWVLSDLAITGSFRAYFVLNRPSGPESVPSAGYININIESNLK